MGVSVNNTTETEDFDTEVLSDLSYRVLGTYLAVVVVACYFVGFAMESCLRSITSKSTVVTIISIRYIVKDTGVLAVAGNICLISFFAAKSNRKSNIYLFIINIATADIIESIIGYPLAVYSNFHGRWMFGPLGCDLYAFTCFTATLSNMMTYVAISIYRFFTICHRNDAGIFIQRTSTVSGTICAIWVYSLLWATIPFFGWGSYGLEKFKTSCSIAWTETSRNGKSFILSLFVFVLFVPVCSMGFMYLKLIKTIKGKISSIPEDIPTENRMNIKNGLHGVQMIHDIDTRVVKIITLTMVAYLIGWLPYGSMSMVSATGVPLPIEFTPIPTFFAKTQPLFNPLIFLIGHKNLNEKLNSILCCGK